jgi:uncharacterized OsmC-like protein
MGNLDQQGSLHIDRARIRAAHEARLRDWPADPKPLTVRAAVEVTGNHRKRARVGSFTIESDEGAIVGGEGTAPTPLSYLGAAIGFAVLTDIVRALAVLEVAADDLRLELEAEFPLDSKYGDGTGSVAAREVRYTVDIASTAPRADVARAVAWAERYCHAVHSLREPVAVSATYRMAGEPLALPGEPEPESR